MSNHLQQTTPGRQTAQGALRDLSFGSFSAILTDIVVWLLATDLAALARFDFQVMNVRWEAVSVLGLLLAGGQLVLGALVLLYRGRYQSGSFDEMRAIAVSVSAVSVIATAAVLAVRPHGIPRSLPFVVWPLALVGMAAIRYVKRMITQSSRAPTADAERILIFGAGEVGSTLALRMVRDPASPFLPVGFLDDDPAKRNLQIHGVRVCGRFVDLAGAALRFDATRVVVAINSADAALIRMVSDAADQAGIVCMVLPPLSEVLSRSLQLSALRDVDVEDVIGRQPVDTDVRSIAAYITGRRVLVTGAGGSIGSELCRQLHKYGPSNLVMLDHDESGLHAVVLSIYGQALLDSTDTILVDIRDTDSLHEAFQAHRPDVVFHAAALKHLPMLERHPAEAFKSNVIGTRNVLEASDAVGVAHFVNISTDKAANPTSALGHSKRIGEQLTAWFSHRSDDARYISVRFGNVLGSRGSVVHAFAAQIERGGPVTVTDPEVTRFFMTIPEACQLVIQAGAIGRPGEVLVLDMGEPVKIADLARRMIAMSGKAIEIVFTGLRHGEKMHEALLGDDESDERPLHPLISHVIVAPLDPELARSHPWSAAAVRPRRLAVAGQESSAV